jgi:hypothetical protein
MDACRGTTQQAAIAACIRQLRVGWQYPGLRASKPGGASVDGDPVFEARASRGDRVTFYWDGDTMVVHHHCSHDILKRY